MNRQFFDARTFLAHVLALTGFVAAFATVLVGPPNGALAASCGHQRLQMLSMSALRGEADIPEPRCGVR